MFKKSILIISILFISFDSLSAEDTISQCTYHYIKKINDYISEENWVEAKRELESFENKYFKNEKSYERALINQLYGQYYLIQGKFTEAIPWLEKAIKHGKLSLPSDIQTRTNLAVAHFQLTNYDDVINALLGAQKKGLTRGIDLSAANYVMLGMAYFQKKDYENAYKNVSTGNDIATKLNEDWLQYEFALAVQLKKYDEAIDVGQYLIFVNPSKDNYWKQLSGVYYGGNDENGSLAGLELAYEKGVLSKEQDFLNLAKYFLYKDLPIKAVKVLNNGLDDLFIEETKKNLDLLSDAYFLSKDRDSGVAVLKRSLEIESDPKTSYKIARFAFESEDWDTAIRFFKKAKSDNWNEVPGRIELLLGITFYEIESFDESLSYLNEALQFEKSKSAAEGWINYIKEINT
jgi:tetratricopeptide (TPR) repeat protein